MLQGRRPTSGARVGSAISLGQVHCFRAFSILGALQGGVERGEVGARLVDLVPQPRQLALSTDYLLLGINDHLGRLLGHEARALLGLTHDLRGTRERLLFRLRAHKRYRGFRLGSRVLGLLQTLNGTQGAAPQLVEYLDPGRGDLVESHGAILGQSVGRARGRHW